MCSMHVCVLHVCAHTAYTLVEYTNPHACKYIYCLQIEHVQSGPLVLVNGIRTPINGRKLMGNWGFLTPNKCSYGFPLLRTGSGAHDVLTPCGAGPDFRQETPWVDPRLDNCEPWRDQTDMTQSASWTNHHEHMYIYILSYIYIHHHIWLRYTVYIHNSYNIYISMPSSSTTSSTIITSSSKTGEKSSSMLIPTKRKYINLRNHHNRRTKVPRCFWLQLPSAPRSSAPEKLGNMLPIWKWFGLKKMGIVWCKFELGRPGRNILSRMVLVFSEKMDINTCWPSICQTPALESTVYEVIEIQKFVNRSKEEKLNMSQKEH